jgi:hypothetical protein
MRRLSPVVLALVLLTRAASAQEPGTVGARGVLEGEKDAPDAPSVKIAPPSGRVLDRALAKIDEGALLGPGKTARIYGVAGPDGLYHPERPPVVLVHGIRGHPRELQAVAARVERAGCQVHVLCYESWNKRTSLDGIDFAAALRDLAKTLGAGRDLTIVAHSLGGVVSRRALNELALGPGRGIELFSRVRLVGIDNPWHGYGGPSDHGAGGFFMGFVRPFMPDGLEDMRARSDLFQGNPSDPDPAGRVPLCKPVLPGSVTIDLCFAQQGDEVHDWTEAELRPLPALLVEHYTKDVPVRGDPRLVNFWRALVDSSAYFALQDELSARADLGKLDEPTVKAALLRAFPRFPGDHMGVLVEHPGERSMLDWLSEKLAR